MLPVALWASPYIAPLLALRKTHWAFKPPRAPGLQVF